MIFDQSRGARCVVREKCRQGPSAERIIAVVVDEEGFYEKSIYEMATSQGADPAAVLAWYRREVDGAVPVDELAKVEARAWEAFNSVEPVVPDRDKVALLAWCWTALTFRHVHAAFQLVANGFHESAYLQVRAAWEHGVYLALLAGIENRSSVFDQLAWSDIKRSELAMKEMRLSGEDKGWEFAELMLSATRSIFPDVDGDWATVFRQVCDKLAQGDEIYAFYRFLSKRCHTGFGPAELFLDAAFTDEAAFVPQLSHQPKPDPMLPQALNRALGAAAWAGWASDKIFGSAMFADNLKPIGDLGYFPLAMKAGANKEGCSSR